MLLLMNVDVDVRYHLESRIYMALSQSRGSNWRFKELVSVKKLQSPSKYFRLNINNDRLGPNIETEYDTILTSLT